MRGLSENPAAPADRLTETLRAAVERHGESAVLLCSFQKEESVLLDELLRVGGLGRTPVRIVTIDTGVLFPETVETWRAFEERFQVRIETQDASGDPAAGGAWTGPEHCCSEAKVAALQRALDGCAAWITGIRREQGPTRAHVQEIEVDSARGLIKYNPLAAWTERDLWRRIHERELPYHPLHDRGYESIGCRTCTAPGSGREGRWAGTQKTECGLHSPPGRAAGATQVVEAAGATPVVEAAGATQTAEAAGAGQTVEAAGAGQTVEAAGAGQTVEPAGADTASD